MPEIQMAPDPTINVATRDDFLQKFGGIYEKTPWIVERTWSKFYKDQEIPTFTITRVACTTNTDYWPPQPSPSSPIRHAKSSLPARGSNSSSFSSPTPI